MRARNSYTFLLAALLALSANAQDAGIARDASVSIAPSFAFAEGFSPLTGLAIGAGSGIAFELGDAWSLRGSVSAFADTRTVMSGEGYFYRGYYGLDAYLDLRLGLPLSLLGLPLAIGLGVGGNVAWYDMSTLLFFFPSARVSCSAKLPLGDGIALRFTVPIEAKFLTGTTRLSIGAEVAFEWLPPGLRPATEEAAK